MANPVTRSRTVAVSYMAFTEKKKKKKPWSTGIYGSFKGTIFSFIKRWNVSGSVYTVAGPRSDWQLQIRKLIRFDMVKDVWVPAPLEPFPQVAFFFLEVVVIGKTAGLLIFLYLGINSFLITTHQRSIPFFFDFPQIFALHWLLLRKVFNV